MCSMSIPPRSPHLETICQQAIAGYTLKTGDSPVDTAKFERLLLSMIAASEKFLGKAVSARIFSAGMRSVVISVVGEHAERGSGAPATVVVKHFRRKDSATNSGGFGYLREKHGLSSLNSLVESSYSQLLGWDDDARFLILEYVLGTHLSEFLSVSSLSENGNAGQDASAHIAEGLDLWSNFWATQLNSTRQQTVQETFQRSLVTADARARYPGRMTSPQLAFKGLEKFVADSGHSANNAYHRELEAQLSSIIFPDPAHSVLSSADFSPQNMLVSQSQRGTEVRGIDAEGTAIHHWALPVAEILLGFPSHPESRFEKLSTTASWHDACNTFYQQVYRGATYQTAADDPCVQAAVMTIRCTLIEQTGMLSPINRVL